MQESKYTMPISDYDYFILIRGGGWAYTFHAYAISKNGNCIYANNPDENPGLTTRTLTDDATITGISVTLKNLPHTIWKDLAKKSDDFWMDAPEISVFAIQHANLLHKHSHMKRLWSSPGYHDGHKAVELIRTQVKKQLS